MLPSILICTQLRFKMANDIRINDVRSRNNIHVNPNCSRNILINQSKLAQKSETKVHYNPKFLNEKIHLNPSYLKKIPSILVNRNFLIPESPAESSRYKYVNKSVEAVKKPPEVVKSSPGLKIKSKYSIVNKKPNEMFKKKKEKIPRRSIVSRYKVVHKKEKSTKPRRSIVSRYKVVRVNLNSEFKKISRTKLIRKSVLQEKILQRRKVQNLIKIRKIEAKILNDRKKIAKLFKNKNLKKKKFMLKKRLHKTNQLCSFYNRFGRCKGKNKGHCHKVHDPKYVVICQMMLQGKCCDPECLLSHEIRPEKMPTCLHFLAGQCRNEDCPFLHVKVNDKAPVCRAFLQGYCENVYSVRMGSCKRRCTKRHEFICPVFSETGHCPKGKCVYPHKSRNVKSKLLDAGENPIVQKNKESQEKKKHKQVTVEKVFSRYFSSPCRSDPEDVSENKVSL